MHCKVFSNLSYLNPLFSSNTFIHGHNNNKLFQLLPVSSKDNFCTTENIFRAMNATLGYDALYKSPIESRFS